MYSPRTIVGYALLLIIGVPLACAIPIVLFGGIMAAIEGWSFISGMLYIGGELVLIPLSNWAPVTTEGKIVDCIISFFSMAVFAWVLALLGSLPICCHTNNAVDSLQSLTGVPKETKCHMISLMLVFFLFLMPLVCFVFSIPLGAVLAAGEGWEFMGSVEFVMGIFGHCPSLAPASEAPTTDAGMMLVLLIALYALAITLGWSIGVVLVIPGMDETSKGVDRLFKRCFRLEESFLGHCLSFILVVLVGAPVLLLPVIFILGAIMTAIEGYDSMMDGVLHEAGNIILIPLTAVPPPSSTGGKVADFICSIAGIGFFAYLLVSIGALNFVDLSAEKIGMKKEGLIAGVRSLALFFCVVLPIVLFVAAVPIGGIMAAAEGWSFTDGWLWVAGVMVQSPGLPPALPLKSDGGKLLAFFAFTYSVSISLGWGVGVIVASAGLDGASKWLCRLLGHVIEGVSTEANNGNELNSDTKKEVAEVETAEANDPERGKEKLNGAEETAAVDVTVDREDTETCGFADVTNEPPAGPVRSTVPRPDGPGFSDTGFDRPDSNGLALPDKTKI